MGLPGDVLKRSLPEGTGCEDCDGDAVLTVQGETDSFGYETIDLCQSCYDRMKDTPTSGNCEWCHKECNDLISTRDTSESGGSVYEVCNDCLIKQRRRDAEDYGDD